MKIIYLAVDKMKWKTNEYDNRNSETTEKRLSTLNIDHGCWNDPYPKHLRVFQPERIFCES